MTAELDIHPHNFIFLAFLLHRFLMASQAPQYTLIGNHIILMFSRDHLNTPASILSLAPALTFQPCNWCIAPLKPALQCLDLRRSQQDKELLRHSQRDSNNRSGKSPYWWLPGLGSSSPRYILYSSPSGTVVGETAEGEIKRKKPRGKMAGAGGKRQEAHTATVSAQTWRW